MATERVLASVGSGLVAGGGGILAIGAAGLLASAVDYMTSGGLEFIIGCLLLVGAVPALVVTAASAIGFGMAVRGHSRFFRVSIGSGMALLAWAAFATGTATRAAELAPSAMVATGIGVVLLLGWKILVMGGRHG